MEIKFSFYEPLLKNNSHFVMVTHFITLPRYRVPPVKWKDIFQGLTNKNMPFENKCIQLRNVFFFHSWTYLKSAQGMIISTLALCCYTTKLYSTAERPTILSLFIQKDEWTLYKDGMTKAPIYAVDNFFFDCNILISITKRNNDNSILKNASKRFRYGILQFSILRTFSL